MISRGINLSKIQPEQVFLLSAFPQEWAFFRTVLRDEKIDLIYISDLRALQAKGIPSFLLVDLLGVKESFRELLKQKYPELPFAVMSSRSSIREGVEWMRLGAEDYFSKPVCPGDFRRTLRRAFEGPKRESFSSSRDGVQSFPESLVYVDEATGLFNYRYLSNLLDTRIADWKTTGQSFAVLFIDADEFKNINDRYGHWVGTELLHELGSHLKRFVRGSDAVFRYGGDEFVAVLGESDLSSAEHVAQRICESVEKTVFLGGGGRPNVSLTVSIGVALFPDHGTSKKKIIEAADRAMYEAKRRFRNQVYLFQTQTGQKDSSQSFFFSEIR